MSGRSAVGANAFQTNVWRTAVPPDFSSFAGRWLVGCKARDLSRSSPFFAADKFPCRADHHFSDLPLTPSDGGRPTAVVLGRAAVPAVFAIFRVTTAPPTRFQSLRTPEAADYHPAGRPLRPAPRRLFSVGAAAVAPSADLRVDRSYFTRSYSTVALHL
jgi:hypothetical protein